MRTISRIFIRSIPLLAAVLVLTVSASAQIPPRPSVPRAVNDFAGVFSRSDAEYMNRVLVDFADSTSNRIVVVTVDDPRRHGAGYASIRDRGAVGGRLR